MGRSHIETRFTQSHLPIFGRQLEKHVMPRAPPDFQATGRVMSKLPQGTCTGGHVGISPLRAVFAGIDACRVLHANQPVRLQHRVLCVHEFKISGPTCCNDKLLEHHRFRKRQAKAFSSVR